jgi:hypothetical protein
MILRGILAVAFGFIILGSACQTIEGSPTSISTLRAIPNIAPPTRTLPILAPLAASEWTLPAPPAKPATKPIAAPETMQDEWTTQDSYMGDCNATPPGTVCVQYSDNYIWLIQDSIVGFTSEGESIEIAQGSSADYYHILNTLLVKTVSK